MLVSHEPINEEVKIINPSKIFKSEECIICLTNQPIILFCNCGHIPISTECYKLKSLSACPICKTENEIIRTLEYYFSLTIEKNIINRLMGLILLKQLQGMYKIHLLTLLFYNLDFVLKF